MDDNTMIDAMDALLEWLGDRIKRAKDGSQACNTAACFHTYSGRIQAFQDVYNKVKTMSIALEAEIERGLRQLEADGVVRYLGDGMYELVGKPVPPSPAHAQGWNDGKEV